MMESGDYINRLTHVLNGYCATLHRLSAENATVDSVSMSSTATVSYASQSPVIDCEITFHDFGHYKKFVDDLDDIGYDKHNREALHKQYPALREAYDEYKTLEKLYGG